MPGPSAQSPLHVRHSAIEVMKSTRQSGPNANVPATSRKHIHAKVTSTIVNIHPWGEHNTHNNHTTNTHTILYWRPCSTTLPAFILPLSYLQPFVIFKIQLICFSSWPLPDLVPALIAIREEGYKFILVFQLPTFPPLLLCYLRQSLRRPQAPTFSSGSIVLPC